MRSPQNRIPRDPLKGARHELGSNYVHVYMSKQKRKLVRHRILDVQERKIDQ